MKRIIPLYYVGFRSWKSTLKKISCPSSRLEGRMYARIQPTFMLFSRDDSTHGTLATPPFFAGRPTNDLQSRCCRTIFLRIWEATGSLLVMGVTIRFVHRSTTPNRNDAKSGKVVTRLANIKDHCLVRVHVERQDRSVCAWVDAETNGEVRLFWMMFTVYNPGLVNW